MFTPFYNDIPIGVTLTIIYDKIFIFQTKNAFAISLLKTLLVIQNEYQYYHFELIGGN
jgi:hypothetical protein